MPHLSAKPLALAATLSACTLLCAVPVTSTQASVLPVTTAALTAASADGRRAQRQDRLRRRSGERVTRQTRTDNGWQRQTTIRGEHGRQATRDTAVTVDRDNRSYDRSRRAQRNAYRYATARGGRSRRVAAAVVLGDGA